MTLQQQIESLITDTFRLFADKCIEKYPQVDRDDLYNIWKQVTGSTPPAATSFNKKPTVQPTVKPTVQLDTCPYVFTKGARKGEKCGVKGKNGSIYCGKHQGKQSSETSSVVSRLSTASSTKKQLVFTKTGKTASSAVNKNTGLYMANIKNKVITGKMVDGKLEDLTQEDIELCKANNLQYTVKDTKPSSDADDDFGTAVKDTELSSNDNDNDFGTSSDDDTTEENKPKQDPTTDIDHTLNDMAKTTPQLNEDYFSDNDLMENISNMSEELDSGDDK